MKIIVQSMFFFTFSDFFFTIFHLKMKEEKQRLKELEAAQDKNDVADIQPVSQ